MASSEARMGGTAPAFHPPQIIPRILMIIGWRTGVNGCVDPVPAFYCVLTIAQTGKVGARPGRSHSFTTTDEL